MAQTRHDMPPSEHDKAGIVEKFEKSVYSPDAGRNFPTQVYFGDTRLHTAASADPDFDPTEKAFYYGSVVVDWLGIDSKSSAARHPGSSPGSGKYLRIVYLGR